MPKSHFTIDGATSIKDIPPGAKIHVSGVCGVAMAQLAVELSRRGFEVSGSDKEFYEPMGGFLKNSAVTLRTGYKAEHVPSDTSLVVIGNALAYENPEVQEVERRNLAYSLFPKLLYDVVIAGKHSIVASGTHGKSTTSALLAWTLHELNKHPAFFVGAGIPGLPSSLVTSDGGFSVTEGDEYDSSFFAKVPKFVFYRPDTLIITAIEFDHADIYETLAQIEEQFSKLVLSLKPGSNLVCCVDDATVKRLVPTWREKAECCITTYGTAADADARIIQTDSVNGVQRVSLEIPNGAKAKSSVVMSLKIPGMHNALNALSALLACTLNGIPAADAVRGMSTFSGTTRRQEVRYDNDGVTLIDDFAHHPTAVRETISAIRSFYPGRRLWAVFEPRSNTSRRKVFQNDYVSALAQADRVILCDVSARASDSGQELIKVEALAQGVSAEGTEAAMLSDADAICGYLTQHAEKGDVFLIMSNGAFGGLVSKFEKALTQRQKALR